VRHSPSAHNSGVIHGAVEPGNVLLADDGGVKLTDIGVHGGATEPAYLAPELKRGGAPTEQSDAYALGAVLFRAVEGILTVRAGGQMTPPWCPHAPDR
jgi:serine/threonine protein kinase